MNGSDPYRYGCAECGSVSLHRRVSKSGYRCNACGHVMVANDRVDRKLITDGGKDITGEVGLHVDLTAPLFERLVWEADLHNSQQPSEWVRTLIQTRIQMTDNARFETRPEVTADIPEETARAAMLRYEHFRAVGKDTTLHDVLLDYVMCERRYTVEGVPLSEWADSERGIIVDDFGDPVAEECEEEDDG